MNHFLLQPLNEASLLRQPLPPTTGAGVQATRHAVEPGQSMEEIAGIHGVAELALRQANDLGPGQAVYPGTLLRVPEQTSPGPDSGEFADTAALRPVAPDTDGGGMGKLTWVPDFKSMSVAQIKKYLESPDFKQMAASEREVAQRLYNAGMKQAAAEYLAGRMKDMPPEVAARLAEECREFIGQLARDAAGDRKMYAVFAQMASLLMKSPTGQGLLREFARNLAGAMSDQQVREFLRTIHEGAAGGQPLKVLVLKELLARVETGTLKSVQSLELRNAITELVKEVYQDYRSAQAAKTAKDREFAAMLARLENSLTDKQKQELYQKFIDDPENAEIYKRAASTAGSMAEMAAITAKEVVALVSNRYELSSLPDLINSLARHGQGAAALELVEAIKGDAKVLAKLAQTTDIEQLERLAAAAALAEATAAAGGDVKEGLNRVLELLEGIAGGMEGLVGDLQTLLEKLVNKVPDSRTAAEVSALLEKAGPWASVVSGLLSMAVALTADEAHIDAAVEALIQGGAATVDTASGIVDILIGLASRESTAGTNLATASEMLGLFGRVFTVLSNSIEVIKSIRHMLENGAPNGGDITSSIGALIGIGAAFAGSGPVGAVLGLASLIVMTVGKAIQDHDKEQELVEQYTAYLQQMGIDPAAARKLLGSSNTSDWLALQGFSPAQIQALAKQHPELFDDPTMAHGFISLLGHMRAAGFSVDQAMRLLESMSPAELKHLARVPESVFAKAHFAAVTDKASLELALEKALANYPDADSRAAIGKMLDWVRSRHP